MSKSGFESFGISQEILSALSKFGYERPTAVQQEVLT